MRDAHAVSADGPEPNSTIATCMSAVEGRPIKESAIASPARVAQVLQSNLRSYDRAALYTGNESHWLCRPAALELRRAQDGDMQYVCDAPNGKTWFRIETEAEAAHESRLMNHTVEKYFRREREKAVQSWHPERPDAIERDIGLEAHVQREMPLFLTLRDRDGNALTTAMLPPGGKDRGGFRIIIVAASNADPYPRQDAAIAALGAHFGLILDRDRCFPYGR